MRRLAIIPARGGSKRIPDKNIKNFCGRPMIAHAIQAAEDSKIFDMIHVSTDSAAIATVAGEYGHNPDFMRPSEFSSDHASMMEAIQYVVKEYKEHDQVFDTVALLYATSPLMDSNDLKKACIEFETTDLKKALLAVTPYPAPIEHAFRLGDNGDLNPNDAAALAMRTQDLKHAYYDAGMFAFYTSEYILNAGGSGDFNEFRGFEVSSFRVTDIDWPEDWERAEMLYKAVHKENKG